MLRLVALVLALAAPLGAQATPKQAVAQLKTGAKEQLKLLKGQIALAHEDFVNAVGNTEGYYELGTIGWEDAVSGAFNASVGLQVALQQALVDSVNAVVTEDAAAALASLGEGTYDWPLDFYFGQDGALDDVLRDSHAAVEKELAAARKRLKKTAKILEKKQDVVLLVQLRLPDLNDHAAVNAGEVVTPDAETLSAHTVFAASRRGVPDDGVVGVAGRGTATSSVELAFSGASTFGEAVLVDSSSKTWQYETTGVAEGNYVVETAIEGDTSSALFNVGVP